MEIERAYLDKGFYGGIHVTALRETGTEFLIKARKVEPVKDVIDGLEEWDVDWDIFEDYPIGDLKQGTNIFIRPSEKEDVGTVTVNEVDALIDEPPAERFELGWRLFHHVRSPVKRRDEEVRVVFLRS